jgi:hypothetical protein
MEVELSLNNILGSEEIDNLFLEDLQETASENEEVEAEKTKEKEDNTTEDIDINSLFGNPESVGSEEQDIDTQEETSSEKESTSSNKKYIYSSIAQALKEEGVFPDVEDSILEGIKNPEDFRDLINKQIQAGLQEKQKRIDEALSVGVEPSQIQKYEQVIKVLSDIKEDAIKDESAKGEQLRKDLIYQDFLNRGYSKERAEREVKKSFDSGLDIEDAKEALASNLDYFNESYKNLINEAKEAETLRTNNLKKQAETLKKSIIEDKVIFGELEVDKPTRQKIYDNISKPVYKDPDTGEYLTSLQKYEKENKTEFLKNVGLIYTLTDGFKSLDKLVKGKVNKEVKKGLRDLERTLNNTRRDSNGNLQYISSINDDSESFIGKGWNLDV